MMLIRIMMNYTKMNHNLSNILTSERETDCYYLFNSNHILYSIFAVTYYIDGYFELIIYNNIIFNT